MSYADRGGEDNIVDRKILKEELFNSDAEFALRVLSVLEIIESPMSLEKILIVDFISCYPSAFGVDGENVVGTNSFLLGELPLRRHKVSDALRMLLFKGLVEVELNPVRGYLYSISNSGQEFDLDFDNDYMEMYRVNVYAVIGKFGNKSDGELMEILNAHLAKEKDL